MKSIYLIVLLSIFAISCNEDCNKVDCVDPVAKPYPGFTIRSASKNLIASKDIDVTQIKAFDILGNTTKAIGVDANNSAKDTFFRVVFENFHKKIKLTWPGDSTIIDIVYKTTKTECCGDFTQIINMSENGFPLQSPNGIIIIQR